MSTFNVITKTKSSRISNHKYYHMAIGIIVGGVISAVGLLGVYLATV